MTSIIAIVIMIIGAVLMAVFGQFEVAVIIGLAVTMYGAGILITDIWKKRKTDVPLWVTIVSLALVSGGAFMLGIEGKVAQSQLEFIISSVVSVALIIAGLVVAKLKAK